MVPTVSQSQPSANILIQTAAGISVFNVAFVQYSTDNVSKVARKLKYTNELIPSNLNRYNFIADPNRFFSKIMPKWFGNSVIFCYESIYIYIYAYTYIYINIYIYMMSLRLHNITPFFPRRTKQLSVVASQVYNDTIIFVTVFTRRWAAQERSLL